MEIFPLAKTDLGPAAKTLVEKIASATGTLYAPLGFGTRIVQLVLAQLQEPATRIVKKGFSLGAGEARARTVPAS
jgi:hypothetical protein